MSASPRALRRAGIRFRARALAGAPRGVNADQERTNAGTERTMLTVVTGYSWSANHGRFYAGGTRRYHDDGSRARTLSLSFSCECGDPLYDGDPILAEPYERDGRAIHVNCEQRARR